MTYLSRPWSAIDAIINAGQIGVPDAAAAGHSTAAKPNVQAEWGVVQSRAAMILSRIMTETSSPNKPCVQFVACGEHVRASTVAMAASQAAASILGRSLLLNARMEDDGQDDGSHQDGPVPDSFVPGLYHHHIARSAADLDLLFGRNRRGALTNMIAPFQFVAIDSRSPRAVPAGTALAAMCTGTVLVVRAGESSHSAIREAALHITRAGGRIIGSILDEAPATLPGWIRRT